MEKMKLNVYKIVALLTLCLVFVNIGVAKAEEFDKYAPIKCGDNVYATLDKSGTLTISGTGDMWEDCSEVQEIFEDNNMAEYIYKVKFEKGVTSVGALLFFDTLSRTNYNIQSVEMSDTITKIGEGAFCGCRRLEEINIPGSVKVIGSYAFSGLPLKKCTFNEGLEKICAEAFYQCGLEWVTIPKSTKLIERCAFCSSLDGGGATKIVFLSNNTKLEEKAIGNGSTVTTDRGSTVDKYAQKYGINIKYNQYKSTLTFNANGGTVSVKKKQVTSETKYGKLPNPKRKGYEFMGWYTKVKGGQRIYKDTLITTVKNSTIYARWKKISLGKMKKPKLSSDEYRKIVVSFSSLNKAQGYEVRYSLKKNMKSSKKVKVKNSWTTTREFKKLKAGKKYYVQVRGYKKDSAGKYVYGKWSASASIKLGAVNAAQYSTKKIDRTKKYNKGKMVAVVTLDKVLLKGKSAAVKKINKALEKEYKKYLGKSSLYEYAREDAKWGCEGEYFDIASADVVYNKNGIICIVISTFWNAGGVNNTEWYGLTFDLNTGKRLKLSDVCNGTDDEIKGRVVAKILDEGDDMNWDVINAYKVKDMEFYILPNKQVYVCFAPYEISYGGWGREYKIEGKYK